MSAVHLVQQGLRAPPAVDLPDPVPCHRLLLQVLLLGGRTVGVAVDFFPLLLQLLVGVRRGHVLAGVKVERRPDRVVLLLLQELGQVRPVVVVPAQFVPLSVKVVNLLEALLLRRVPLGIQQRLDLVLHQRLQEPLVLRLRPAVEVVVRGHHVVVRVVRGGVLEAGVPLELLVPHVLVAGPEQRVALAVGRVVPLVTLPGRVAKFAGDVERGQVQVLVFCQRGVVVHELDHTAPVIHLLLVRVHVLARRGLALLLVPHLEGVGGVHVAARDPVHHFVHIVAAQEVPVPHRVPVVDLRLAAVADLILGFEVVLLPRDRLVFELGVRHLEDLVVPVVFLEERLESRLLPAADEHPLPNHVLAVLQRGRVARVEPPFTLEVRVAERGVPGTAHADVSVLFATLLLRVEVVLSTGVGRRLGAQQLHGAHHREPERVARHHHVDHGKTEVEPRGAPGHDLVHLHAQRHEQRGGQ